jgi:hypothetical protein
VNGQTESDLKDFAESYARWLKLARPTKNVENVLAPAHIFEVDLDHTVSDLVSVGRRTLEKPTQFDYSKIVPQYLEDIDRLEARLHTLSVPDRERNNYRTYLGDCRQVWERMKHLKIHPDGHLSFRGTVLRFFEFLQVDFHFLVVDATPIKVRFESESVYAELSYSPDAPMLSFMIGKIGIDPNGTFVLDDILYIANHEIAYDYSKFDLETEEGVIRFIGQAADLVRHNAEGLLRGDPNAFRLLEDMAAEREQRYIEEADKKHRELGGQ